MAGSTFGNVFRITTWGESHGKALGAVVDGCPAGLRLCEADIQKYLDRRRPGQSKYTTARAEGDEVQILSGVFEGLTTGTPISLIVYNRDQHSHDYSEIASCYRPGHADYTFDEKYGFRDYRGGGRSSGRETIGRVAAGAIAALVLKDLGIELISYTRSIGGIDINDARFDISAINANPLYMPDREAAAKAMSYLDELRAAGDSAGGVVECILKGVPAGIGETVFDKLDAELSKALMSIGAVKAVEIGAGISSSSARGSENNDPFRTSDRNTEASLSEPGQTDSSFSDNKYASGHETCDTNKPAIIKQTNHSGGILGGMSDGSDIILRAHFKPTPSISMTQQTVNKDGEQISINIKGRHDPVIVPRAVVVVESMAAVTVLDLLMRNMSSRLENLHKIYNRSDS